METIAASLDKHFLQADPWKNDLRNFDLITWGWRNRFSGFLIEKEALAIDWKRLSSFRVKLANIATVAKSVSVSRLAPEVSPPYDLDYIQRYFRDNEDNPFGVWNSLQAIRQPAPRRLTQFPPLTYPKDSQQSKLDALRDVAMAGDLIVTYNRKSGLSSLIRRLDWCMWSHVAMFSGENTVLEVTTGGATESPFDYLRDPNIDTALYRYDEMKEADRPRVVDFMRAKIGKVKGYAWRRVIRIALKNNMGIPYKQGKDEATPADMMYANQARLVCYA